MKREARATNCQSSLPVDAKDRQRARSESLARLRLGWTRSYILGKMTLMKSATRVTSKGQVVIPKPVRDQLRWMSGTQLAVEIMDGGAVRLTPFEAEDAIDTLYGCLKDIPRDPLADLEAEHRAEIAADERWQRRGR